MSKSKPRQLSFAFADSPKGGTESSRADVSAADGHQLHTAKLSEREESTPSEAADTRCLLERVASPGNLVAALCKVVRNKGAPGVDRITVKQVAAQSDLLLGLLHDALLAGTYMPGDIRRVWIPKPGGGQRGLGIPNVVDRVVQQALLQALEPIFEPTFHPSSHGFRPGRGAQTAIAEAREHVAEGRRHTVDIDLSKFFDRVNHQRLLDRLAQRIEDARILRLIRLMLKAKVVLPDGTRTSTDEGTPQGGPLSPLLSNIVLDELDWELDRRGHCFVRYADDCNVYVRSERAGQRTMASLRRFIENRLRLKINDEKSAVALAQTRHFLGFRIGATRGGRVVVMLSQRTLDRFDLKLQALTPRNWGRSLDDCLDRLNRYLQGWMAYFHLCTREVGRTLRYLDAHIRRRLRAIVIKQKKRPRHLYRNLLQRGVSPGVAYRTAFARAGIWRKSSYPGMHRGYPNQWFGSRLASLSMLWERFDHARQLTSREGGPDKDPRFEEPDVRPTSPVL